MLNEEIYTKFHSKIELIPLRCKQKKRKTLVFLRELQFLKSKYYVGNKVKFSERDSNNIFRKIFYEWLYTLIE